MDKFACRIVITPKMLERIRGYLDFVPIVCSDLDDNDAVQKQLSAMGASENGQKMLETLGKAMIFSIARQFPTEGYVDLNVTIT